jgi:hypothetical protein
MGISLLVHIKHKMGGWAVCTCKRPLDTNGFGHPKHEKTCPWYRILLNMNVC